MKYSEANLEAIPQELGNLIQWAITGSLKPDGTLDKAPHNPRTLLPASVSDSSSWGTFTEAVSAAQAHDRFIGLMLTQQAGYCVIDLDDPKTKKVEGVSVANCNAEEVEQFCNRHSRIAESFDSYQEYSVSGTGIHIVVRGIVPSGARRDRVEIYSDSRFMIFTGVVFRAAPIGNYQALLDIPSTVR